MNSPRPTNSRRMIRSRLIEVAESPVMAMVSPSRSASGTGLNTEIDIAQYFEFVTARDIANITAQLAVLIGAAVPMAEALTALVDQTEKNKLKVILSNIKERVNEGITLADALGDAAMDLAREQEGVDDLARIVDRDMADELDLAGIGVDIRLANRELPHNAEIERVAEAVLVKPPS